MTLADDGKDAVVGMVCIAPDDKESTLLVVSEKGNGKRSEVEEYRLTKRGGKGVKTIQITDKTGMLVAIKSVKDDDDLMITNRSGIIIRMAIGGLRVMGRATQGVRVIRLDDDDNIADVTVVKHIAEVEGEEIDGTEIADITETTESTETEVVE